MAKTLINPFGGSDDEDFDVFYLINRNFQLGFIMIQDQESLHHADECDLLGDESPPVVLPERSIRKSEIEKKISFASVEQTTTTSIKMLKLNDVTCNSMENLVELFEN